MLQRYNLTIANVYLVQGAKTILVDTGAPFSRDAILKMLKRVGVTKLDLILLTHGHGDHAGSALALRQATTAPIAIHEGDVAMVQRGTNGEFVSMDLEARIARPFVDRPFPPFNPDIVITAKDDLVPYGLEAHWMHTPGHSDGSISLLFPNGDAIVGDILRGGWMGGALASHVPNYPFFLPNATSEPILLSSIRSVLDAGAQKIYVGHGGYLNRAAVEQWLATRQRSGSVVIPSHNS